MSPIDPVDKTAESEMYLNQQFIPRNWQRVFFAVTVLLAAFHLPIIWFDEEAIGLFDFFVIVSFIALFMATVLGQPLYLNRKWREYFLVLIIYIGYISLSLVLTYEQKRPILLYIKVIENNLFLVLLLLYFESNKDDILNIVNTVQFVIFLVVVYQLFHYFTGTPVAGESWYRVGLPFMKGVSSNPAGFVLGVGVLFYIGVIFKIKRRNIFTVISFLLLLVALAFTQSRTNILALIIISIVYSITNVIKNKKAIIIVVSVFISTIITFSILSTTLARQSSMFASIVAIMTDPNSALTESSFVDRYMNVWPVAIDAWMKTSSTVLFGNGLGYIGVADNTYLRVLANQGILGFILFSYIWFGFFWMKYGNHKWLKMLLLFLILNAISADTLVTSYRAMQMFLVLLVTFLYTSEYLKDKEEKRMIYQ